MTLFSYEIFDAVARQGSFNKAAQQLHLTPSAISHAIAVMEEELGFALFNRGKNGVSMTSYGASLYPSIREVLNSDEALKQSIALGYALATTPIDNIDTILATADRHMYQEKIQHHQTRHQHIDIDN